MKNASGGRAWKIRLWSDPQRSKIKFDYICWLDAEDCQLVSADGQVTYSPVGGQTQPAIESFTIKRTAVESADGGEGRGPRPSAPSRPGGGNPSVWDQARSAAQAAAQAAL